MIVPVRPQAPVEDLCCFMNSRRKGYNGIRIINCEILLAMAIFLAVMPHYVVLINWTDQGIKNVRESPKRAQAARSQAESFGGKLSLWYTLGQYDIVAVAEFPSDEAFQKFAFWVGSLGSIRTTTLKAWSEEEAAGLISSLP